MNTERLLNLYFKSIQTPDSMYQYWEEIFGRVELPMSYSRFENGECNVPGIDWIEVNKKVREEIVKSLAAKIDGLKD